MSLLTQGGTAEVSNVVITDDNTEACHGEGREDALVTKDKKLEYTVAQIPPIPLMIGAALQRRNLDMSLVQVSVENSISSLMELCGEKEHRKPNYMDQLQIEVTLNESRKAQFKSNHLLKKKECAFGVQYVTAMSLAQSPDVPAEPELNGRTDLMLLYTTQLYVYDVFKFSCSMLKRFGLNYYTGWRPSTVSSERDIIDAENITLIADFNMSHNATTIAEPEKLQKLAGSLMAASLVEIVVGATGVVGFMLRYIGPVTVAPTISLVGFSLYKIPILYSRSSWEIALSGAVIVIVLSLFLENVQIPLPSCGGTTQEGKRSSIRLFGLFPVLLSILTMWTISALLTITNVFPDDPSNFRYMARTDAKSSLIHLTSWLVFPYPGQFGMPGFSFPVFVGFSAAFFSSFVESVGDYFAGAKACEVDTPPNHAVNRGILMEGLSGLLSGAVGVAHATTSYSGNIAMISVTKTGSRSVMVCAGLMLIIFAFLGKFGAALACVPDPVVGGVIIIICGLLVSIGFSTLRYVNLSSSRNLTILGLSLFVGVFLPEWIDRHPDVINTGNTEADAVLKVTLGTHMFVGGMVAMILDNIVQGTLEDRGISMWRKRHGNNSSHLNEEDNSSLIPSSAVYGWHCVGSLYKKLNVLSYLPFMPPRPTMVPSVSTGAVD
ncbi:solute carrier family 23 member 1-like [Haliotis asinina]|uniref:solute carrier family 23 member 1-like n=1 Tax=Haliotis asinina TaxID=109174 RepID=UPI003531FB65